MSISRGNCKNTNNITGVDASPTKGIRTQGFLPPNRSWIVAPNAIIINNMERNNVT
ncbi:hypothetical protein LguiB_021630 [Lonicera macranthoides]